MKKINFLITFCVILVGFTLNSQNVAISDKSASLSWTQNAQLVNTIVIGANSVNTAGATDAIQNVGLGVLALDNLKFGDNNTAVGYKAGTGIAGANGGGVGGADSGSGNTLIGRAAGYLVSTGEFNTVLGNQAGGITQGGDYNTFVGSGAKGSIANNQGRIGLGQGVVVSVDNTAVIGKSTVTKVYFGSESYEATLYATGINLENDETITNATDGTIAITAATTTFSGNATFAGNVTVNSDMRLKDNILPLGSTMTNILKLDGKSYTKDGREEIGLLAQDVQLVYPELVSKDANGILSVNYQALSAILINGVKDQEARIQKLEILVKLLLDNK